MIVLALGPWTLKVSYKMFIDSFLKEASIFYFIAVRLTIQQLQKVTELLAVQLVISARIASNDSRGVLANVEQPQ